MQWIIQLFIYDISLIHYHRRTQKMKSVTVKVWENNVKLVVYFGYYLWIISFYLKTGSFRIQRAFCCKSPSSLTDADSRTFVESTIVHFFHFYWSNLLLPDSLWPRLWHTDFWDSYHLKSTLARHKTPQKWKKKANSSSGHEIGKHIKENFPTPLEAVKSLSHVATLVSPILGTNPHKTD